ncbi:MAG TPA: alpha/beta hydrolase-fold protein [Polyangia bacterium]
MRSLVVDQTPTRPQTPACARTPLRRFSAVVVTLAAIGACNPTAPSGPRGSGTGGKAPAAPGAGGQGGIVDNNNGGAGGNRGAGGTGGRGTGGATAETNEPPRPETNDGAVDIAESDGPKTTRGIQMDPGSEGDGTFPHAPPYMLGPASTMLLNGAPAGKLLGPIIYTQKGQYTGWSAWKFTYWVHVPAQYRPGRAAALMVLQDGAIYMGRITSANINAVMVLDNLSHEGSMPVTITVFIDPGTSDGRHVGGGDPGRSRQYDTPNDQYGKFIIDEFLPSEILSKYDIVTDPDGWASGGHSSGGIAAIIKAFYYPDRFRKVITASPSFPNTGGRFPAEFSRVPAKPLRIYHMAGTRDLGGWYAANNQAAMIFKERGYHHRYRPAEIGHYPPASAAADLPDALRWLWRGYQAGR